MEKNRFSQCSLISSAIKDNINTLKKRKKQKRTRSESCLADVSAASFNSSFSIDLDSGDYEEVFSRMKFTSPLEESVYPPGEKYENFFPPQESDDFKEGDDECIYIATGSDASSSSVHHITSWIQQNLCDADNLYEEVGEVKEQCKMENDEGAAGSSPVSNDTPAVKPKAVDNFYEQVEYPRSQKAVNDDPLIDLNDSKSEYFESMLFIGQGNTRSSEGEYEVIQTTETVQTSESSCSSVITRESSSRGSSYTASHSVLLEFDPFRSNSSGHIVKDLIQIDIPEETSFENICKEFSRSNSELLQDQNGEEGRTTTEERSVSLIDDLLSEITDEFQNANISLFNSNDFPNYSTVNRIRASALSTIPSEAAEEESHVDEAEVDDREEKLPESDLDSSIGDGSNVYEVCVTPVEDQSMNHIYESYNVLEESSKRSVKVKKSESTRSKTRKNSEESPKKSFYEKLPFRRPSFNSKTTKQQVLELDYEAITNKAPPNAPPPPVPQRKTSLNSIKSFFDKKQSTSDFPADRTRSISSPNLKQKEFSNENCVGSTVSPCDGKVYATYAGTSKDLYPLWCVLDHGKVSFYLEKDDTVAKNSFSLKNVSCITSCQEQRSGRDGKTLHCITVTAHKEKSAHYVIGLRFTAERAKWMQALHNNVAPSSCYYTDSVLTKAGYLQVKESVSGEWSSSWVVLKQRILTIYSLEELRNEEDDLSLSVDLQKVTHIHSCGSTEGAAADNASGGFVLNTVSKSFYFQSKLSEETDQWYLLLKEMWQNTDSDISQQLLTEENVPVLVDKCIKFIDIHGVCSEGIYRRSGTKSRVTALLEELRRDPWKFYIRREDYSEHDVATALKRYFHMLTEPVITCNLYKAWVDASRTEDSEEKLNMYKDILGQLPCVNYSTLKRVIGHLHIIHSNCNKNLMPYYNLSPLWGPTLMSRERGSCVVESYSQTNAEGEVVKDLILFYPRLFNVGPEELEKERRIQEVADTIREGRQKVRKLNQGEMIVPVEIITSNSSKSVSVVLVPTMKAQELVDQILKQEDVGDEACRMWLFEELCEGNLQRPIHPPERVLNVVLHWPDWPPHLVRGSRLLLKRNNVYEALLPHSMSNLLVFKEVKFAESKVKTFKKYMFEFSRAKLKCFKDKKFNVLLNEWNIEDISWYIGVEPKRNAPTSWAITFVNRNGPVILNKNTECVGNTLCFTIEEDLWKWAAAMLLGEHPAALSMKQQPQDLLT